LHCSDIRVIPKISNDNNFIHASGHGFTPAKNSNYVYKKSL
jgi:hypothetical protein